jgi:hypothetical protein
LAGEDVTPLPPRLAICAVLLAASWGLINYIINGTGGI